VVCREEQLLFEHGSCFSDDGCDFVFEILDYGCEIDGALVVVVVLLGFMDICVHFGRLGVVDGGKGCNSRFELVHCICNQCFEGGDFCLNRKNLRGMVLVGDWDWLRVAGAASRSGYCVCGRGGIGRLIRIIIDNARCMSFTGRGAGVVSCRRR